MIAIEYEDVDIRCHLHFRLVTAIFDFQHTQTSDSITICLSVFLDPENTSIAIEISLLLCVRAEIYVISYLFPFNGRQLQFLTCPGLEQQAHNSLRVVQPVKHGIAVIISLLLCIEAELYVMSFLLPVNGRHL